MKAMGSCSKQTIDGTLEGAVKRERHGRRKASGPRVEKDLRAFALYSQYTMECSSVEDRG